MKTSVLNETPSPGLIGLKKRAFSEILVPTDFSLRSDKAVNYAVDLARRLESHLTLLHVVPAPYAIDYALGGIPNGQWEEVRHRADQKLEAALQRAKIRYESVDPLLPSGLIYMKKLSGPPEKFTRTSSCSRRTATKDGSSCYSAAMPMSW